MKKTLNCEASAERDVEDIEDTEGEAQTEGDTKSNNDGDSEDLDNVNTTVNLPKKVGGHKNGWSLG